MSRTLKFFIIFFFIIVFNALYYHALNLDYRIPVIGLMIVCLLLVIIFYVLGYDPTLLFNLDREWIKHLPKPSPLRVLVASFIAGLVVPITFFVLKILEADIDPDMPTRAIILYPVLSVIFFIILMVAIKFRDVKLLK